MSAVQACAEVEAVIQRARSLFASAPDSAHAEAGALATAAQMTLDAGTMTSDLSCALVARHKDFVGAAAGKLAAAAQTDTTLQGYLGTDAALTEGGARRLDAIAAQTRATAQAASGVSTPEGEQGFLAALRSQVAQAGDAVNSVQRQAAGLAGQIRTLQHARDVPSPPESPPPGEVQAVDYRPNPASPPFPLPETPASRGERERR
jgi:hypothetical protein